MKIETLDYGGFMPAIKHAMRNPMDSWGKSDTTILKIGEKDKTLSLGLQKAGPEHCKHLRMIVVWADITAPRYWWQEFDTYRTGVEKVSCSTMHKLMARHLDLTDFEKVTTRLDEDSHNPEDSWDYHLYQAIDHINDLMDFYKDEEDLEKKKRLWRRIITMLPQSYLQKRTVMMSYAALRNIYHQREGHKLYEWQMFREWAESLPESWMITE